MQKCILLKLNITDKVIAPLDFEMLEGLQVGSNITWKVGFQKNMSKNLQLSISYNGRKSEKINHTHR